MIAANYVKFPEQMQHQKELWSKSKRDTIMMRIGGLIMRGRSTPGWVQEARARAKALSQAIKTCCRDWVTETAEADQTAATGFKAHVRWFNAERAKSRWDAATAIIRPLLGFCVPRQAKPSPKEKATT